MVSLSNTLQSCFHGSYCVCLWSSVIEKDKEEYLELLIIICRIHQRLGINVFSLAPTFHLNLLKCLNKPGKLKVKSELLAVVIPWLWEKIQLSVKSDYQIVRKMELKIITQFWKERIHLASLTRVYYIREACELKNVKKVGKVHKKLRLSSAQADFKLIQLQLAMEFQGNY